MTTDTLFNYYKEYLIDSDEEFSGHFIYEDDFKEALLKFAKFHVEQALIMASEKVELTDFAHEFLQEEANNAINKKSILNAYNLDNIK